MEIRHIPAMASAEEFEKTLQTLIKEIYEQDFYVVDVKYQFAYHPGIGTSRYSALVMFEYTQKPKPQRI
jgi:hypothetical protein